MDHLIAAYGIDGLSKCFLSLGHLVGLALGLGTTLFLDGGCVLSIVNRSWCGYRTFMSGALFAFITSFDEVVVVLQMADVSQRTIPRQMFSGIREQISPTILAVATILVTFSVLLLTTIELLRRRSEKLRGVTPS